MAQIRLKYVHQFRDRHGKLRRYVRLPGRPKVSLPGLPGSAEFIGVYAAAIEGEALPPRQIGSDRTKAGTINAAIVSYLGSAAFAGLAQATRQMRRRVLERLRKTDGDKRVALLQRH